MCRKLLQPMKSSMITRQQRRGMLRDQIYEIIPDMLKNIGPAAVRCLKAFYDDVMTTENIPKLWRSANVIAIRKHGKPLDKPTSYRSISLLCFFYKLLGRLILTRLATIFESAIRPEQADFQKKRNTCDQDFSSRSIILHRVRVSNEAQYRCHSLGVYPV